MNRNRLPRWTTLLVVAVCALPALLTFVGLDLGSTHDAIDPAAMLGRSESEIADQIYRSVSGVFSHTILEWSAFCAALLTAVLAFAHFRATSDPTTPILGFSLFCAGSMDAFHILAVNRLVDIAADDHVAFTWALSRAFKILVLTGGVGLCLWYRPKPRQRSIGFVLTGCLLLAVAFYAIIDFCASSASLPQSVYPNSWIKRPWDAITLGTYLLAAMLVLRPFDKRQQSLFSHAVLVSLIPGVVTQFHMAIGSAASGDHHFNAAHFLKIVEYLVPFAGLTVNYAQVLRERELDVWGFLEGTPDSVVLVNEQGDIVWVNTRAERFFGYDDGELAGRPSAVLLPEGVRLQHGRHQAGYLADPHPREMGAELNVFGRRKDGSEVPVEISLSPLKTSQGFVVCSTIRDISERKRAEESLQRYVADLEVAKDVTERQAEHLRVQAEELARSNQELQQFAYVASHDLQEPLRMISGYTQLLARRYQGKLDADADEFIGYAVDGAGRMQALINDLLEYSRVGRREEALAPTDCETVFGEALVNLKTAVEESGATVTHEPLPTVMADRSQLCQLFQNLIGNALKYRGEKPPSVRVEAELRDSEWVFAIDDNGIGIAPEHYDRVFQMFQRLHGRGEYSGTGIGLALCRKIVDRHGGRIWVESQVGEGSTFYFTLPKKRVPTE